jgi:hypothetical protein
MVLDEGFVMRRRIWRVALVGAFVVLVYGSYRLLVEDDTQPGVCELHHIPYATEIIRVEYGYPARNLTEPTEAQRRWQEEEHAAWWESFRYSHVANGAGGCVVRPARFAKVSYCPECRKVDEAWHAKHGHFPPTERPE